MPSLELAYDVGITYAAGSDTSTTAMEVFVMAAVLYGATFVPKARKEIDDVVGQNRMTAFSDIPALPLPTSHREQSSTMASRQRWRDPARCHQGRRVHGVPHPSRRDCHRQPLSHPPRRRRLPRPLLLQSRPVDRKPESAVEHVRVWPRRVHWTAHCQEFTLDQHHADAVGVRYWVQVRKWS